MNNPTEKTKEGAVKIIDKNTRIAELLKEIPNVKIEEINEWENHYGEELAEPQEPGYAEFLKKELEVIAKIKNLQNESPEKSLLEAQNAEITTLGKEISELRPKIAELKKESDAQLKRIEDLTKESENKENMSAAKKAELEKEIAEMKEKYNRTNQTIKEVLQKTKEGMSQNFEALGAVNQDLAGQIEKLKTESKNKSIEDKEKYDKDVAVLKNENEKAAENIKNLEKEKDEVSQAFKTATEWANQTIEGQKKKTKVIEELLESAQNKISQNFEALNVTHKKLTEQDAEIKNLKTENEEKGQTIKNQNDILENRQIRSFEQKINDIEKRRKQEIEDTFRIGADQEEVIFKNLKSIKEWLGDIAYYKKGEKFLNDRNEINARYATELDKLFSENPDMAKAMASIKVEEIKENLPNRVSLKDKTKEIKDYIIKKLTEYSPETLKSFKKGDQIDTNLIESK